MRNQIQMHLAAPKIHIHINQKQHDEQPARNILFLDARCLRASYFRARIVSAVTLSAARQCRILPDQAVGTAVTPPSLLSNQLVRNTCVATTTHDSVIPAVADAMPPTRVHRASVDDHVTTSIILETSQQVRPKTMSRVHMAPGCRTNVAAGPDSTLHVFGDIFFL